MSVKSLHDLLEKPFKSFTEEEQLEIVRRGRFTDIINLSQLDRGKKRTFWTTWYQKVKWLTGDTVTNKLYCWQCVLFSSGRAWSKTGYDDLRNLSQAARKHGDSREHVYSTIKLRLMSKKNERRVENAEDGRKNVEVKRNREYMERLIDVANILARLEAPFRNGPNKEGLFGNMVHLLKKYDDIARSQLEQNHNFQGLTETIQVDLVQSMEQVLLQRITEEVSAAAFFSLIVDEMNSDISSKRISISIRYVYKGVPVERFIGLYEINHGAKAEEVAATLNRELEKFNYKEKMITQSYDGKVVKATELYSLQQTMKSKQQAEFQSLLVHYYAHDFRLILAQTLNSVQECKLFFSIITVSCKFFQNLNLQPNKKSFESIPSCIATLKTQHGPLQRLLEYITTDEQYENSQTLVADAVNLINHLRSFKFMVFVTMFDEFFTLTLEFMNQVKDKTLNDKLVRKAVIALMNKLKKYKENSEFNNLIKTVTTTLNGSPATTATMFSLNVQIVDSLIQEIESRFLDLERGEFFPLFHVDNFTSFNRKPTSLDGSLLFSLKDNFPKLFDMYKLKNELELFYGDPSIGGFGECPITHVKDILKFIHDNDIRDNISELYKLLELIVTVPLEPLEGDLCVLNRINAYRKSENSQEPRSSLAVLAIEKDLLMEMGKSDRWYSRVIDQFAKLPSTSSIELVFRDVNDEYSTSQMKTEVITEPELEIKTEPDF